MSTNDPYRPEQLAITTMWSLDFWRHAYNAYGWRPWWPQLVDAASHGFNPMALGDAFEQATAEPLALGDLQAWHNREDA